MPCSGRTRLPLPEMVSSGRSRRVRVLDRLDIDGLDDARIAALYAFDASWYFWRENVNRIAPAWYLALTLPEVLVGNRICTRGHVYWASNASWFGPRDGETC